MGFVRNVREIQGRSKAACRRAIIMVTEDEPTRYPVDLEERHHVIDGQSSKIERKVFGTLKEAEEAVKQYFAELEPETDTQGR